MTSLALLDELAHSVRGPLHRAGPLRSAVLAAADAYDVACAVRLAATAGVRVATAGTSAPRDGLLLVDLTGLSECDVHPAGWARVGAGAGWAALRAASAPLGLVLPPGGRPEARVAHDAARGGPVARAVRAVDVVTPTGRLVRATPADAVELFDRLREGREVTGIITALELDLPSRTRADDGGDAP